MVFFFIEEGVASLNLFEAVRLLHFGSHVATLGESLFSVVWLLDLSAKSASLFILIFVEL